MKKRLTKFWCWLRGHDIVETYTRDNGRSFMREHTCLRCGMRHDSQYDYSGY